MADKTRKERLDDTLDYLEEVTSKAKRKTVEALFDGLPESVKTPMNIASFSKYAVGVRDGLHVIVAISLNPNCGRD